MKFILIIVSLLLFTFSKSIAQVRKTYTVKPGEKISESLPKEALYLYPQFKDGVVNFKNTNVGASRLNYNRLLDEIQFIDEKGDTLSLADDAIISSVYIDRDTFYYYQGYVKMISDVKKVKFAIKKKLALSNKQKVGGMGELSSASIDTYEKMSTDQGIKDIISTQLLTFSEYTNFFIGDFYNHFKPLNKKTLLNMFAKQQTIIEIYLSENSINFFKEEDVKKLIGFLKTL